MNSLPAYFFSDAHLGANPPGAISSREEILVRFLRSLVGKASHVFLVGDLFEFWYEYRHYIARGHFPLYRVLGDLSDFGAEVHLLMGNHDFALEDFFPGELGVRVHRHFVCENLQGHNVFLMHGDGIPGSDRGYRLARKILDARISRFLFRKIHPDLGMDIARFVGNGSRAAGKSRKIDIGEYLEAAGLKMRENGCDICVHGHHHIPGIWNVPEGKVVSPGQWLFELCYAKMENGEISVSHFSEGKK